MYKMRFVKFSLNNIFPSDEEKVQYIYDKVYGVLKRLYEHYDNVSTKGEIDASSSSRLKGDDGQNFVGWWSDKCTTYKVLSSVVKDILANPVSAVASEYAFSTSGRVVDDFRSNFGVKIVEALICTEDWLRASNVCIDLEQLLEDVKNMRNDRTPDLPKEANVDTYLIWKVMCFHGYCCSIFNLYILALCHIQDPTAMMQGQTCIEIPKPPTQIYGSVENLGLLYSILAFFFQSSNPKITKEIRSPVRPPIGNNQAVADEMSKLSVLIYMTVSRTVQFCFSRELMSIIPMDIGDTIDNALDQSSK
ncbi:hypothetical protein LXL04_007786 [Taraxacum kok-saghyz]